MPAMKRALLLVALAAVVAVPFALRPRKPAPGRADTTLVILTPHNEAIRYEFGHGFERWYRQRTGKTVFVDWRVIGGTSEIARYLAGAYTASFEDDWTHALRRPWSNAVEAAFDNPRIEPAASPAQDTAAEAARRAFLASDVGCGVDLFFGGDTYNFGQEARAGHLVPSGVRERHPDWFTDDTIPRFYGGEEFWDRHLLWAGTVLSCYGILYSKESCARLGVPPPRQWEDLADPRYFGEVALADPTKSSSIATAFENILQQEMQNRYLDLLVAADRISALDEAATQKQAVREGWLKGLRLVQLIGANARYFTDSSQKVPIDVAAGDCAAGLCIDFYGREEEEAVRRRGGSARLAFVTPPGGTAYSVDPIGLLRGAKHGEVAELFIDWVLSLDGQKLWNFKPGTPGGPEQYALRRLPVRRDFYTREDWKAYRSDPDAAPFDGRNQLIYHESWTGPRFGEMSFIIRVMCQDTHDELASAWRAVVKAGQPPEAMAVLQDLSAVDYGRAAGEIHAALTSPNKADALALAKRLEARFRAQYRRAADLARLKR